MPTLQFLDGGDYVGDIKGENNKTLSIGGTSVTLDCISFSEDVYIGRDLAIQDDIVVNDDAYVGGTIYCQGKLRVPVGTNLY